MASIEDNVLEHIICAILSIFGTEEGYLAYILGRIYQNKSIFVKYTKTEDIRYRN